MGKRRIRLDENDLVAFLTPALADAGYLDEGAQIVGFEFKTKRIKRGGDYYKDGVSDPDYPGEVEIVRWIKVLTDTGRRRRKEEDDVEPVQDPAADGG